MAQAEQLIPSDKIHISSSDINCHNIIRFIVHDGRLYCYEYPNIRRWTGDEWIHFTSSDSNVTCLASYGGQLYSGHGDGLIRSWTEQGQCDSVLNGNPWYIYNLIVVGENLYGVGTDNIACCWDRAGKMAKSFVPPHMMGQDCWTVFGEMLYIPELVGDTYYIRAWNIGATKYVYDLIGHTSWVNSMLIFEGRLYSGSNDITIRCWNMKSQICEAVLEDHKAAVRSLCLLGS